MSHSDGKMDGKPSKNKNTNDSESTIRHDAHTNRVDRYLSREHIQQYAIRHHVQTPTRSTTGSPSSSLPSSATTPVAAPTSYDNLFVRDLAWCLSSPWLLEGHSRQEEEKIQNSKNVIKGGCEGIMNVEKMLAGNDLTHRLFPFLAHKLQTLDKDPSLLMRHLQSENEKILKQRAARRDRMRLSNGGGRKNQGQKQTGKRKRKRDGDGKGKNSACASNSTNDKRDHLSNNADEKETVFTSASLLETATAPVAVTNQQHNSSYFEFSRVGHYFELLISFAFQHLTSTQPKILRAMQLSSSSSSSSSSLSAAAKKEETAALCTSPDSDATDRSCRLLLQNQQVRQGKSTLGEIDFMLAEAAVPSLSPLSSLSHRLTHVETAVKLYLDSRSAGSSMNVDDACIVETTNGISNTFSSNNNTDHHDSENNTRCSNDKEESKESGSAENVKNATSDPITPLGAFLGTNVKDVCAVKIRRMLTHQLALSTQPIVQDIIRDKIKLSEDVNNTSTHPEFNKERIADTENDEDDCKTVFDIERLALVKGRVFLRAASAKDMLYPSSSTSMSGSSSSSSLPFLINQNVHKGWWCHANEFTALCPSSIPPPEPKSPASLLKTSSTSPAQSVGLPPSLLFVVLRKPYWLSPVSFVMSEKTVADNDVDLKNTERSKAVGLMPVHSDANHSSRPSVASTSTSTSTSTPTSTSQSSSSTLFLQHLCILTHSEITALVEDENLIWNQDLQDSLSTYSRISYNFAMHVAILQPNTSRATATRPGAGASDIHDSSSCGSSSCRDIVYKEVSRGFIVRDCWPKQLAKIKKREVWLG